MFALKLSGIQKCCKHFFSFLQFHSETDALKAPRPNPNHPNLELKTMGGGGEGEAMSEPCDLAEHWKTHFLKCNFPSICKHFFELWYLKTFDLIKWDKTKTAFRVNQKVSNFYCILFFVWGGGSEWWERKKDNNIVIHMVTLYD